VRSAELLLPKLGGIMIGSIEFLEPFGDAKTIIFLELKNINERTLGLSFVSSAFSLR